MSTDDLSTPLGQGKVRTRRKALRIPWSPIIAALFVIRVVVITGTAMFSNDPLGGGEPMAVAPATVSTGAAAASDTPATPGAPATGAPPVQTATPATPPGTFTDATIDGGTRCATPRPRRHPMVAKGSRRRRAGRE